LNKNTGKLAWRAEPWERGEIYASLVLADNKLYLLNRAGSAWLIDAGLQFKLLAHNTFAGDKSLFYASPAVSNSQLLLRSDRYLYCAGKSK
jgi:hypothetical protein